MSVCDAYLPCPICSHVGVFNTVQSLRDRLIYVSTNTLTCPVCQEEVSGLDKLTIHLFSHVKLLVVETKKQGANTKCKKKNKNQISTESTHKSVNNTTKNSPQSFAANSPVKYVKICPKPPKLSLSNVPIISLQQENHFEKVHQPCETAICPESATKTLNEKHSVCNICGLEFTDSNIFEMHNNLVHNYVEEKSQNVSKFRCHVCPKIFKMRGSLMVHLRVAHFGFLTCDRKSGKTNETQINETSSKVEAKPGKLVCLEKSDNKQWQCDVCQKYFTTKYFLKKHKRLHTGETPYACTQCNKTFTFQQSYHKHLLYHNDEKPHICSYCGRAFKELSTLHNHQRIHTGEKPFSCETCGKCFRQRVSYLVHRRIHTGVMPYKCTACNKSFRYKVSQRTHKCLAQPPGIVIRQCGELVEKLKKKQSSPEHSYQDIQKEALEKNDQINQNNTIHHSEISEANAELIRSGAKLSLEDMESEYFKLIPESTFETANEKFENLQLSNSNINNFSICDELFTENISNLIDCIHDEDKNAPSPSEILQNLCL